jgi:hypothetical protein
LFALHYIYRADAENGGRKKSPEKDDVPSGSKPVKHPKVWLDYNYFG